MKRRPITVILATAVLVLCVVATHGATNQVSADQLISEAYSTLVGADSAAAGGTQHDAALAGYRKALDLYVHISDAYPGYQTTVINYRIAQCLNEIQKLKLPGAAPAPAPRAEKKVTPGPSQETALPRSPESEISETGMTEVLPDEPLNPEEMSDELVRLTRERDTLAAHTEQLSREVDHLNAKLSGSGACGRRGPNGSPAHDEHRELHRSGRPAVPGRGLLSRAA